MPSIYEDKNARKRRQREHTRRKVVCQVCGQLFEVFQGAVQTRKYCEPKCGREADRRMKAKHAALYQQRHGPRLTEAKRAARAQWTEDQREAERQRGKEQNRREAERQRGKEQNRREAAVRRGKAKFAGAGCFVLVRGAAAEDAEREGQAGHWEAVAEGYAIDADQICMAWYEWTGAVWGVLPVALACPKQMALVRRLKAIEARIEARAVSPLPVKS